MKPDCIIGAVGRAPNCFNKAVIEEMCKVQEAKAKPSRPLVFALSNPKSQAECTAEDCYKFSKGAAIFGSGTRFPPVEVDGATRDPGQVHLLSQSSEMHTAHTRRAAQPCLSPETARVRPSSTCKSRIQVRSEPDAHFEAD